MYCSQPGVAEDSTSLVRSLDRLCRTGHLNSVNSVSFTACQERICAKCGPHLLFEAAGLAAHQDNCQSEKSLKSDSELSAVQDTNNLQVVSWK